MINSTPNAVTFHLKSNPCGHDGPIGQLEGKFQFDVKRYPNAILNAGPKSQNTCVQVHTQALDGGRGIGKIINIETGQTYRAPCQDSAPSHCCVRAI